MENLATIAFETNANILAQLLPNLPTDNVISKVESKECSKSRPSRVENANQKKLHQPKKTEARKSISKKAETSKTKADHGKILMPKETTPLTEVSENVQKISLQDPSAKSKHCNRKPSNDAEKVDLKENEEFRIESSEIVNSYNLRKKPAAIAAVAISQAPVVLEEKDEEKDETVDDEFFKKPNLANITIARLMPKKSSAMPSSPIAGGNLGPTMAKVIPEKLPNSPPSSASTMSSTDLTNRLKDFSESMKPACASSLYQSMSKTGEDVLSAKEKLKDFSGNLSRYEDALTAKEKDIIAKITPQMFQMPLSTYKFSSPDINFMPLGLAHGRHYLFVVDQSPQQHVKVFRNGKQKGNLKMNNSKNFPGLKSVHFILDVEDDSKDMLIVLDSKGFHLFSETGEHFKTLFEDEGSRYRGLANVIKDGINYIVSIDVKGRQIVLINCEKEAVDFGKIRKRIEISPIKMMDDKATLCRFVTSLPKHNDVIVTSMSMNKIFIINLITDTTGTMGPFRKPNETDCLEGYFDISEPSGIVVDPETGLIFVSSCKKKSIEVLAPNFTFLGTLKLIEKMGPLGLAIKDRYLFAADGEGQSIMRIQLPKVVELEQLPK